MKIALLILLGLILGALGGAALGVGAGLAWVEIFKTSNFEGYSGMLVFFGFLPGGAVLGALAGAIIFGVLAIRDQEIAIERPAKRPRPARPGHTGFCAMQKRRSPLLCNAKKPIGFMRPSP